jgi:FixJ family two-component response regulator
MTTSRQLPCPCRVDPDGRRWINLACHIHGLHVFDDEPISDYELRALVDAATIHALAERQADLSHNNPKRTPVRRAAVKALTARGATAGQIASVLGISSRTVTRHRTQGASR